MFADIIIDISHEKVDKTFQYKIPSELLEDIAVGSVVLIPFGRGKKPRKGFVVGFSEEPEIEEDRIKQIIDVDKKDLPVESELIALARWMKHTYGGTLSAALKTVLPVKRVVRKRSSKNAGSPETDIHVEEQPLPTLNEGQQEAYQVFEKNFDAGIAKTYLLYGITGSGKTRVYIEMMKKVIAAQKKVIVLIPEIALTGQNIMRFKAVFGSSVGVLHSRLSDSERYEVYERAREGSIDIVLGPRSALFAPFSDIGLIIVDEEHETSYKSEQVPKYHSREVALKRAEMESASVVLGSATPELGTMKRALEGEFELLRLNERTGGAAVPTVSVVDMREELKKGNRSMLSDLLMDRIKHTLDDKKQVMLFLNRRGVAGFVSCRSCGHVLKCPHCDVSLHQHRDGYLRCHYCGFKKPIPKVCPECGSKYIGGFKAGTQSVENLLKKLYPQARVLRMDADTTKRKGDHQRILKSFADGQADILLGTQMIVKGHDFGRVTLVGVLAADLSLNAGDYTSAERTFDLLVQASGRAGRGDFPGECIIQTYDPDHYAIAAAAAGDYEALYNRELTYRGLMGYPPMAHMLLIQIVSPRSEEGVAAAEFIAKLIKGFNIEASMAGPCEASITRLKDLYRFAVYLKARDYNTLIEIKDLTEERVRSPEFERDYPACRVFFDFDPLGVF